MGIIYGGGIVMIVQETFVNFDGRELVRTYSDAGRYIVRNDGKVYEETVDPPNTGRTYTEGDLIPQSDISAEEALDIITGVVE